MIKQLLLVALGGGVGSALRYLTSCWVVRYYASAFPLATFTVNVLGCFLIGFLSGIASHYTAFNENMRFLLIVGFCGGYTTFSTFSAENLKLYEMGNYGILALYVIASVVIGFLALYLGQMVSKMIVT